MHKKIIKKRSLMTSVVVRACERCKSHHKKCSGTCPCERCLEADESCVFPYVEDEDVFEIIDKRLETFKSQKNQNAEANKLLKADRQQKIQELEKIQASGSQKIIAVLIHLQKLALVRQKITKFFSIPSLSTYVYWYTQIISPLTGTVIPYPDLETLLQDDHGLKNALMMSIIGCGALINSDIHTAQRCTREALEFVGQYESGDETVVEEEMSLLYNISFCGLSIGDWQLASDMWERLKILRSSKKDLAATSSANKSKQDYEEENTNAEDSILGILSFDLNPRSTVGRSDPTEILALQHNDAHQSTNLVQDLVSKARMLAIFGTSCMSIGTKLDKTEVNKNLADLIQRSASIPEDTLSVFVLYASDQHQKAIQHCNDAIYLGRILIAQMPHYVLPYLYLFTLLPFLRSIQFQEQIQSIGEVFAAPSGFIGQLFWHQYNLLMNDQQTLPFLANFLRSPFPPDLAPNSPKSDLVDKIPLFDEISNAVKCFTNDNLTKNNNYSASTKNSSYISQSEDIRVSS